MSTSISSAASTATWAISSSASGSTRQERVPGHVKAAAEALGMEASEVMGSLKNGKSLFDIADTQGVSRDDLLSALKTDAPREVKNSADADAMIEALASTSGVGGPGGVGGPRGAGGAGSHQGPPPPPPGQATGVLGGSLTSTQQSTLTALSDLLGTDSDSLLAQLRSGTDLTDLLSTQGVTLDQLSSKLEEGLLIDTRA